MSLSQTVEYRCLSCNKTAKLETRNLNDGVDLKTLRPFCRTCGTSDNSFLVDYIKKTRKVFKPKKVEEEPK